MEHLANYLDMGGYARFVWPAYGLVALVMIVVLVLTLRTLSARERELAALQREMPVRRGRRPGTAGALDQERS